MSAFIECRVCGDQVNGDSSYSDAELTKQFGEKGWTIMPTRCPEHASMADADIPRPEDCTEEHDPEPFQVSGGIMVGGRAVSMGSRRTKFRPRPGFCRIMLHSVTDAKEFRSPPTTTQEDPMVTSSTHLAHLERIAPLVKGVNALAAEARRNSVEHGFGTHGDRLRVDAQQAQKRLDWLLLNEHSDQMLQLAQRRVAETVEDYRAYLGNRAMLIVGEAVEAHEELRDGRDPLEVYHRADGKPEGVGPELADILIRVFDTAQELGIDLEATLVEKMAYNAGRPAMHGRKF